MIEPSTFTKRWQKQIPKNILPELLEQYSLIRVSPEAFANRNIPEASKKFLIEAGLPKSAAPCLYFTDLENGLRSVWEVWGVPVDWNEADRLRLRRYCVIGSDGNSDNPICIDEVNDGNIITLEHEDWFTSVMFVNSSVPQLAEFLLLFNGAVTKQQIVAEFERVDPAALKEGCLWRYELDAELDV